MAIPQFEEVPPQSRLEPSVNEHFSWRNLCSKIFSRFVPTKCFIGKFFIVITCPMLLFLNLLYVFVAFVKPTVKKTQQFIQSIPYTILWLCIVWIFLNTVHLYSGSCFFLLFSDYFLGNNSSAMLPPNLVIGVLSSRDHFMQRQQIRYTWAAELQGLEKNLHAQLVFVVGDEECHLHPKLRQHPNLCQELGPTNGIHERKWRSSRLQLHDNYDVSGEDTPCLVGLGLRPLTDVFITDVILPRYPDLQHTAPKAYLHFGGENNEEFNMSEGIENTSTNAKKHIWFASDNIFLPAGAEVEIILELDDKHCSLLANEHACQWSDGLSSVQYTFLRLSDGSVQPWTAQHCPAFTINMENGMEKCPAGWTLFSGQCYFFSSGHDLRLSWTDAAEECSRRGGILASVTSEGENRFLGETMSSRRYSMWIGLHSAERSSEFTWVEDGSKPIYTNWEDYEPNNMGGREQCVEMHPYSYGWNDNYCSDKLPFVCKKPRKDMVMQAMFPTDPNMLKGLTRPRKAHSITLPHCAVSGSQAPLIPEWHVSRASLQHSWLQRVEQTQRSVLQEQSTAQDLLLLPGLLDSYAALPEKVKALIQWTHSTHPGSWLLKTDDDTHVNVHRILKIISSSSSLPSTGGSCSAPDSPAVYSKFERLRAVPRFGKWAEYAYSGLSYPEYPAGGGYLMTASVVAGLADAAPHLRSYQGEDVSVGTWLASLTFSCDGSPHSGTVLSEVTRVAAAVLYALNAGVASLCEELFLARLSSSSSAKPPVPLPPDVARVSSVPARLVSVPCWLRSAHCNHTYTVAPNLSLNDMDQLHRTA